MARHSIPSTIRHILLGAATSCAIATPLLAADDADAGLEEIVVTGTRLRGADAGPVGSPLIALDRDAITAAGAVTVDRILREIPQNFDLGVSENSRGQSGGAGNIVYGNTVNLRGIGPYATLVLVDSHRVTNNTRSTDPSIIPTLGVERVEVLADGASAIYGSDAIAGVVNILPRRTLDGVEVFGRYGVADNPSFNEWVAGIAGGKVWDRGQVMLAYEHADRSNLSGDDRDFFTADQTSRGGGDYRTTRCNPGTLRIGTTTYAIPQGGLTPANAGSLVAGSANRCDELTGQDLFPEQSYNTANLTATFDFNDTFTLFGDAFYSKREFLRYPAYATAQMTVPQTNAWFVRPAGFTGTSYLIDYNFAQDLPRNFSEGQAENWQVTPGLRVHLPNDWQIEALIGYGETDDNSESYYATNNTALNAALASSDPATAFDPYGLNRTSQSVRDLIANQIFFAPTKSDFVLYELRADGKLFELPGGDVGLAVGFERQEIGVDLGSARGGPTTPLTWRHFDRDVNSAYAEVLVPLFGAGNARPGLQRLQLSAAVRYDDYSDVGDTTNPKIGLSWQPLESLTVRASWGTSFRAPIITQIYGNSNNLFNQNYVNPAGGANIPGTALSGQNLNLGPEEATTWSAGVDWKPLDNLQLSLTYFDVEYENQVEAYLGNLAILSQEPYFAGTGIILRGTEARDRVLQLLADGITVAAGSFPGGSPNNVTLFVDGRAQNLGLSLTQGLDFQGAYAWDTASAGTFTFSLAGSYILKYEVAITSTAPLIDRLNTIFNPLELKLRAGVDWQLGPARAQVVAHHVNGYTNNVPATPQNVGSYTPIDVSFSWNFSSSDSSLLEDLEVGLEVRNAFDEDPPYVNLAPSANGSGGYDATASNPVGRLFGVSLRKKW
jgi:iron complex outermembrane receptor protein